MFENNYDYAQHTDLSQRFQSGANWFYWIAGLTLVTSIIGLLERTMAETTATAQAEPAAATTF